MRKKDFEGRIITLINNVNDNFDLYLKSTDVIIEQIEALNIKNKIDNIKWSYKIDFEINKKKYKSKRGNSGHISKEFTYGWNK